MQRDHQLDLFRHAGVEGAYRIRRSNRARNLAIHVRHADDIEVVVPAGASAAVVQQFVESKRDWITRACQALEEQGPAPDLRLPNRIELPLCGQTWVVLYDRPVGKKAWRDLGHSLEIGARQDQRAAGRRALRAWLQDKGRQVMVPQLKARAANMGMPYTRVQIRGQKTRWGSYSSSGTVSLNYCLLFAPPDLADYLYVHELCHSQHMNHSKAYWRLVSKFAANYRRQEARLNKVQLIIPDWLRLD